MRNNATEIFSVFGQIESVAAEIMIEKQLAERIEPKMIPPTASVNEIGQRAKFAIIITGRQNIAKFYELVADLRA